MNMNLLPSLAKAAPLSREDFAYETIKEAILGGELLPNQKISLTSLAQSLGVSIIPVNNAVRRLTSEGLIKQDPHHSPYVEEFSSSDTNEVLIIRYHLEELALKESILKIDDAGFTKLHGYIAQMRDAIERKDNHTYGKTNRAFHMAIYEFSGLSLLTMMIDDLWNKAELNRCRSVFTLVPHMAAHSFEEHLVLLENIEKRDFDAALKNLREHKNYSRVKLLESLESLDAQEPA
ncbi:MAG: GntR family transcriptional regulator [Anaerolineaceae bacterium]|nr:GntR family transcriptional regulator [Anaerolineaceae bacterium]